MNLIGETTRWVEPSERVLINVAPSARQALRDLLWEPEMRGVGYSEVHPACCQCCHYRARYKEVGVSTVVEVLRRGRELYASAPSHVADPQTPARGTYCPLTAILAAASPLVIEGWPQLQEITTAADWCLQRAARRPELVRWNAENSTETVLEAWDRAIAAAEAKT